MCADDCLKPASTHSTRLTSSRNPEMELQKPGNPVRKTTRACRSSLERKTTGLCSACAVILLPRLAAGRSCSNGWCHPCRLLSANTDPRQDLPVRAATIASAFLVTTRTITKSSPITSLFTPTVIPLASRADHPSAQPDEDPHLRRPLLGVGRRPPRPS